MNKIIGSNKEKNTYVMIIYMLAHAFFWCSYASTWSYTAVYLKSCGYNNLVVGLVTGIGAVISAILQPILAMVTKHHQKMCTKTNIIAIKAVALLITIGIMCKLPGKATIAILFTTLAAIDASIPSMLSSMAMEYMNTGKSINYGLARGTGSIAYALFSLVLGYIVSWWGAQSLMLLYIATSLITIGVVAAFPSVKTREDVALDYHKQSVVSKYPFLVPFLIAAVLLFMGHNMINVFLLNIIERANGSSQHLGIALAISATVELPVMGLLVYIARKIKVSKLLVLSAVFFTVKSIITIFAADIWTIYMAQFMQFGAFALFTPASVYFINAAMKEKDRSFGQALLGSFTLGLGGALGNVLGGVILQFSGLNGMLMVAAILSVIGICFMMYCMYIYEQKKQVTYAM